MTSLDRRRLANLAAAVAMNLTAEVDAAVSAATGLAPGEALALTALANVADGASIDVLRGMVGLSQPGCARLVDRLTRQRLVRRGQGAADRRVVSVSLTALGRRRVVAITAARAAAVSTRLAALSDADAAALERVLSAVAAASISTPRDADAYCRMCDPGACGHPDRCPTTQAALRLAVEEPLRP